MGRPAVPTALKAIRGNPGRKPLNKREPKPSIGLPACPKRVTGEARKHWNQIGKLLAKYSILTDVDCDAFEQYCELWKLWRKAATMLDKEGEVLFSDKGMMYTNPWHHVYHAALKAMRPLQAEFGMTPSARSKLMVDNGQPEIDEFESEFLRKTG